MPAKQHSASLSKLFSTFLSRSEVLLSATFAGLILLGGLVLSLPISHGSRRVPVLDAIFTSASAVCVTGLTVVDTGTAYSRFGHAVIMLLIQLGGLGIMTFAALGAQVIGRRLSFRSQAALHDSIYQSDAAISVRADLKWILTMTFLIEGVGMVLIYISLRSNPGGHPAIFSAAFHAISAFCNAGFSQYPQNLTPFRGNPLIMFTIMGLIVLGGLGHTVVLEIVRRVRLRVLRRLGRTVVWSLHARVVLTVSAGLIVAGTSGLLLFGQTNDERTWGEQIINALFQSVSSRTAGFNTIDIGALPTASLLVLVGLMFIGGSPSSCAGGIKTTSFAVWLAHLRAQLTAGKEVVLFQRRVPDDIVARAALIGGLAVLWNVLGCFVLCATQQMGVGVDLVDLLFEQISAFGTVGLSTGVTPQLTEVGKLWIIATMFVGRVGPLTAALVVLSREASPVRYPQERLMVG